MIAALDRLADHLAVAAVWLLVRCLRTRPYIVFVQDRTPAPGSPESARYRIDSSLRSDEIELVLREVKAVVQLGESPAPSGATQPGAGCPGALRR